MSNGCPFCEGHMDALEVTLTGRYVELAFITYGGTRYFVHGATYKDGATHLWLVPARLAGEE